MRYGSSKSISSENKFRSYMKWYATLFAPLAVLICLVSLLLIHEMGWIHVVYETRNTITAICFGVTGWGAIQAFIFPRRPYKSRYRIMLILCVLVAVGLPILGILIRDFAEENVIPLALAAFASILFYSLRHKKKGFSIAPG